MAPPSTRRPGFSRRAQYGLFLGYVVAVSGVLFSILLLGIAVLDPSGYNALKGAALDVTRPISAAGRGGVRFFGGLGSGIADYIRAGSQNDELRRYAVRSRQALIKARATELENQRLKALLGLTRQVEDEVVVTRVVGSSFDSVRRTATLSAGSSSGVAPGQPVRAAEGLIGRIVESGRWASRVLLVSDGASNVPVRLVRDGTPAIATGRGDGTIDLRTLEIGKNPFRRGDILVTSGVGGIYPPNIPLAVVTRVDGELTIAKPLADPSVVDFAVVLRPYQPLASQPLSEDAETSLQGSRQ
jgi:rod shape-determining protein MreC